MTTNILLEFRLGSKVNIDDSPAFIATVVGFRVMGPGTPEYMLSWYEPSGSMREQWIDQWRLRQATK